VHNLEGEIQVRLLRDTDAYLEDILDDISFSKLEVIYGDLVELSVYNTVDLCVECGENIVEVQHRNGGMVCYNCAVGNEEGEICPNCGEKVPYHLMAGNGFCQRCTDKSDYL
jgi:hypothetical protein